MAFALFLSINLHLKYKQEMKSYGLNDCFEEAIHTPIRQLDYYYYFFFDMFLLTVLQKHVLLYETLHFLEVFLRSVSGRQRVCMTFHLILIYLLSFPVAVFLFS